MLHQAHGIVGKKGVLWWQIHRLLGAADRHYFLENVDSLLNSPASQRGRDFAIMLASVSDLGYAVEWRVVNAADYGFPQSAAGSIVVAWPPAADGGGRTCSREGVLARALPVLPPSDPTPFGLDREADLTLDDDLVRLTDTFGRGRSPSPFLNCGLMVQRSLDAQRRGRLRRP